ncbi:MAG: Gfo/Idh/MocA family protein, partial [Acidimicrobiia bacterium]
GMGVHHLDAFRYCLGQDITSIDAHSFTLPWSAPPVGSSMTTLLEFQSGISGVYSATYDSRGHEFFKRGQEFYARFVGSAATLHLVHKWLVLCRHGKLPRLIRAKRRPPPEHFLLDQLTRAIELGEEPECSGRDNLLTVAALEAFVRSTEERRRVSPTQLLNEVG